MRDVSPEAKPRFIQRLQHRRDGCRRRPQPPAGFRRDPACPWSRRRQSRAAIPAVLARRVGLGHVRRNLTLAAELVRTRPDALVLLVTGAEDLDAFSIPDSVDVLRLPGLSKVDNHRYAARRLSISAGEVRALRAALLSAAVETFRPDVVLADKHPGGVQGELVPALERHRAAGGRAAFGLRDVLDEPKDARREWRRSGAGVHLADFHHLVLVYGQADLLDPLAGLAVPSVLRDRVRFCGYVVDDVPDTKAAAPSARARPMVLATVGGGEDGTQVLRTLLQAARHAPWGVVAVTGPHATPAARAELEPLARVAGASLVRSCRDLGRKLDAVDAVVCMGGYNSLTEVLAAAVPAVCVPRVTPRTEQLIRAHAFADRGLLRVLEPTRLDADRLRSNVDAALATNRAALAERIRRCVDLGGAGRAAGLLLELAASSSVERHAPDRWS